MTDDQDQLEAILNEFDWSGFDIGNDPPDGPEDDWVHAHEAANTPVADDAAMHVTGQSDSEDDFNPGKCISGSAYASGRRCNRFGVELYR